LITSGRIVNHSVAEIDPEILPRTLTSSGGSAGVEEQAVNQPLVLQGKRSQFTRKGEDRMDIARGQQLPFALLQPTDAGIALAPWAMPVATRVIRDGGVPAAGALIAARPARRCGNA
jgi:hypothetical protein